MPEDRKWFPPVLGQTIENRIAFEMSCIALDWTPASVTEVFVNDQYGAYNKLKGRKTNRQVFPLVIPAIC